MQREFGELALEVAATMRSSLRAAGGFELVMASERDPGLRVKTVASLLDRLDLWSIDAGADADQAEAAALACRVAGEFALPYPIAERLAADGEDTALAWIDPSLPLVNMGDLPLRWNGITLAGERFDLDVGPTGRGSKLGPFVVPVALGRSLGTDQDRLALAIVLRTFTLLGMLDAAYRVTVEHVQVRRQFDTALITLQAVQYQLVDALVVVSSTEELARYALWSWSERQQRCLVDAVAAYAETCRAADVVFRVGHQLHGATGFCDESAVSWLSRHSHSLRRIPVNGAQARRWLTAAIREQGFGGLFSEPVVA